MALIKPFLPDGKGVMRVRVVGMTELVITLELKGGAEMRNDEGGRETV
jgi:hypothetical protein